MAKCLFVLLFSFFDFAVFCVCVCVCVCVFDHIFVLSDQNSDLAGHVSFQKKNIIGGPAVIIIEDIII